MKTLRGTSVVVLAGLIAITLSGQISKSQIGSFKIYDAGQFNDQGSKCYANVRGAGGEGLETVVRVGERDALVGTNGIHFTAGEDGLS